MRGIVFLITLLASAAGLNSASSVTLVLRMDWRGGWLTHGQVFWSAGAQEFDETRSSTFVVKEGPQTLRVEVPSNTRWLRFKPAGGAGKIGITGARFHAAFLPVDYTEFDSPRALGAWSPDRVRQLEGPVLGADAMEYTSIGTEPYLLSPPLYGLVVWRWLQILVASAVIAGVVAAAAPFARARKRRYWLASGTAAAAGVALVALGISHLVAGSRWFGADLRDVSVPGYDLSFYDMWGRPVSTRRGPLALVIDPFTIYRNYPNQSGEKFRIDANGFRESGPARARTAFVLGGSAAFGLGAPSDEDTFAYRMSAADPSTRYTNAAVVGFQSGQELALMIHHLDAFGPKLYLAVDGWNDVEQNLQDPHGDDLGFNHSTFDLYQDHLFKFASLQASGLPGRREPVSAHTEGKAFEDRLIQRYLENVERMSAFAKSRGARFALAIQPVAMLKKHLSAEEEQRSADWRNSKPTARATAVYRRLARETLSLCSRLGVACTDLNANPEFLSSTETFFTDDCHLTSDGNRWIASALSTFIH